ncbi:SDR family NAD(P)-dependent oxidoreductase [Legionella sp. 16cNR16C]|uniref:SDR family NAD(P)-dependent oxidoreductase n=1 Tax=Legionella sp. 16cNR16C TaxID=2905656 RepID=UPI001E4AD364|nr:SDR family NAD(P)-dependent oxidoreductase [Legionella sp. 16cNR16C]MCE3045094.1 SDR family NAD(P)-dependent oxidoreductase [Legionella sp. 16cNR16C]
MKNKPETVVVVGATRGIGLGFVEKYLALDCKVIATYRATSNLLNLRKQQERYGDKLILLPLDLADTTQIDAFTKKVHESEEKIDLLILNAGTTGNNDVLKLEPKPLDPATFWQELELSRKVHEDGPLRLILGLEDKLQNENACIVYLTTPHGLGSKTVGIDAHAMSKAGGQSMIYSRCKAMVKKWADACKEPEQLAQAPGAFAIYPGWAKTDMGGSNARLTVADSVDSMVKVIDTVISTKKFAAVYSYNGSAMNPNAYTPSEELIKVIASAEKTALKIETPDESAQEVRSQNQQMSNAILPTLSIFAQKESDVRTSPHAGNPVPNASYAPSGLPG